MECPKCHQFVEDSWKMCPHCRTQLSPVEKTEEERNSPLEVYKNKAIWKIMPGEVAYHVRESELENFDQITGLIIEEGVSAHIYVDGNRVAKLSSGFYEFTSQWEIDKILNERTRGIPSKIWKTIVEFFKGEKVGDKIKLYGDLENAQSMEDILRFIRKDSVISIYLKFDKSFPLVFGAEESTDAYKPITVRTQLNEIGIGLTMQLQITDFNEFIPHFLVEKKNVTRQDLCHELSNDVEAVLRHQLAAEIIDERGFLPELRKKIEEELMSINDLLHGISITRIVEISCDNADFERFRGLAKEIYIADREMDYMRRTQEMKNRVVSFENDQKIHEARSTYELDKVLREINKDDLLDREEFRKFERMLEAQRKIADAKSDWEVKSALNDLKRSEMLSDDELDKIADQIQGGKIQRESINELLMIESANRAAQAKLEMELLLTSKTKDFDRNQLINDAKTEDTVERIRAERERDAANDAMERMRKMRQMQIDADNAELEMKRRDDMERKAQDYSYELDKNSQSYKHEEAMKDKEVTVELRYADIDKAKALLAAQNEREAREREEARSREERERESKIFNQMADRDERMLDRMRDVTLAGFASAGGAKQNNNANQPAQQETPKKETKKEYFVLSMGNVPFTLEQVRSFVLAGLVKADSLIRIDGQDWQAGTITELADLFIK